MDRGLHAKLQALLPFDALVIPRPSAMDLEQLGTRAALSLRAGRRLEDLADDCFALIHALMQDESAKTLEGIRSVLSNQSTQSAVFEADDEERWRVLWEVKARFFQAALRHPMHEHLDDDSELLQGLQRLRAYAKRQDFTRYALAPDMFFELDQLAGALKGMRMRLAPLRLESFEDSHQPWSAYATAPLRAEAFFKLSRFLQAEEGRRLTLLERRWQLRQSLAQQTNFASWQQRQAYLQAARLKDGPELWTFEKRFERSMQAIFDRVDHLREKRLGFALPALYDRRVLQIAGDPPLLGSPEEFMKGLVAHLQELSGEETYLSHLLQLGYHSNDPKHCAILGGHQALPSAPASFLCLPMEGEESSVPKVYQAAGRGLASLAALLNFPLPHTTGQDPLAEEVSGLIFFVLSASVMERFYEPSVSHLRMELAMTRYIQSLPEALAGSRFLRRLDRATSYPTSQEMQAWYLKEKGALHCQEAADGFFSQGKAWQLLLLDDSPVLEGTTKLVAFVTVFAMHPFRCRRSQLLTALNRLLLSDPHTPILLRLNEAGFPNPFTEDNMQKAFFAVCDALGL